MDDYSDRDKIAIELARTREILRSHFPMLAHHEYGDAQKDPFKVCIYIKAVFLEAEKKGLIQQKYYT